MSVVGAADAEASFNQDPPVPVQALRLTPHPTSWALPKLRKPTNLDYTRPIPPDPHWHPPHDYNYNHTDWTRPITYNIPATTPALLMLHIFSTVSDSSRRKRDLIRRYSPLQSIPMEYRHLVEVKFILGRHIMHGPKEPPRWGDRRQTDEAEGGDVRRGVRRGAVTQRAGSAA